MSGVEEYMRTWKSIPPILVSGIACLFILNCSFSQIIIPSQSSSPNGNSYPTPSITPHIPIATRTLSPTSSRTPTVTPTAIPAWIEDFAEPILKIIDTRPADFSDNFSPPKKGWDCMGSPHFIKGTFGMEEGVMRFLMDKGEAFCSNNILIKMDFVLTLDLILVKGNEDSCEQVFFHNQTPDYWYVFEICGDTTWNITKNWAGNFTKLASGSENISPMGNTIHIAILTMGAQAAVYLNEEPVAYFNDLDFNASGKTLFMCSAGTSPTVCEFDNIKFWTL